MLDRTTIVSGLVSLYRAAPKVADWDKNMVEEFIRVGEWELALDEIAGAYLDNGAVMPADLFEIFEKLAVEINIEDNDEGLFEDVAELRARIKACLVQPHGFAG